MPITVTITDELADQLKHYEAEMPDILQLGIRELQACRQDGYIGMNSVLEKLASLPSPQEILALRPAPDLQQRIDALLLDKNRTAALSSEEQREWDRYQYVEHLVRLAKISAVRKLKEAGA